MFYVTGPSLDEIQKEEQQRKEYWNIYFAGLRAEIRKELEPIKDIDWDDFNNKQ